MKMSILTLFLLLVSDSPISCQILPLKKIYLNDSLDINLVLTQERINQENTIYIIESVYKLDGTIELPIGSIIRFDGGAIEGGVLKGNYNEIVAPKYKIFSHVSLIGHFSVNYVYPEWWGGYPNRNIDCYDAIQSAINFASAYDGDDGKIVQLSTGKYGISKSLLLKQGCSLVGISPKSTCLYSLNGQIEGEWMIDTPYNNRNHPVSSSSIEKMQVRCTNSMIGEQFENTCNGIRCRGWNENCRISKIHINGYKSYGLYLSKNERTITQNCIFSDIFITNTNNKDGRSVGLYLDDARQNVFESITVDNGPGTKEGVGYGIYANGHCDMNVFCKLNLEDCNHPIYVKDGIDECSFISLMISNPTHPMKSYLFKETFRSSILMEQCNRGFTIISYKRSKNEGVEYDIVDLKHNKKTVFNENIKTGNSNQRHLVYEPKGRF